MEVGGRVTGGVCPRCPSKRKRILKTFQRSMEVRGRATGGLRPCTPPPGPLSTSPETSRAPAPSQVTGHVKKKKEFQKLFRDPWRSGGRHRRAPPCTRRPGGSLPQVSPSRAQELPKPQELFSQMNNEKIKRAPDGPKPHWLQIGWTTAPPRPPHIWAPKPP
jgi:hypothetical protein